MGKFHKDDQPELALKHAILARLCHSASPGKGRWEYHSMTVFVVLRVERDAQCAREDAQDGRNEKVSDSQLQYGIGTANVRNHAALHRPFGLGILLDLELLVRLTASDSYTTNQLIPLSWQCQPCMFPALFSISKISSSR